MAVVFCYDCGKTNGRESPQTAYACASTAAQSNIYTNQVESVLVTPGLTRRWQTGIACISKVITALLAYYAHDHDHWGRHYFG